MSVRVWCLAASATNPHGLVSISYPQYCWERGVLKGHVPDGDLAIGQGVVVPFEND